MVNFTRLTSLLVLVALLTTNSSVQAQGGPGGGRGPGNGNGGGPNQPLATAPHASVGTDRWTLHLAANDLFVAHDDTICGPSIEIFVEIVPDGTGYCMEVNHRPAATFNQARLTYTSLGKRLLEPVEW